MQVVVNWAKVLPLCGQNLWYRTLVVAKGSSDVLYQEVATTYMQCTGRFTTSGGCGRRLEPQLWEDLFVNYWYRFPVLYVFARLAPAHKMGKMG